MRLSGPLPRYLRSQLLLSTLGVLVALGGLLQVLDLLESTNEILSRRQGLAGIGWYTLLRAPTILMQALPLAALVGAVVAFSGMARANEVMALRALGLPFRRVLLIMLPTVALVALTQLLLAELLVPASQKALTRWWAQLPAASEEDSDIEPLWLRTDGGLLRVETVYPDGRRMDHLRYYTRDATGRLSSRLVAASAVYADRKWTLTDVVETDFLAHRTLPMQTSRPWPISLSSGDLRRLSAHEPYVSGLLAADILAGERTGAKTLPFYRTRVQQALVDPLVALIMVLLATPVALALVRGDNGGALVLRSLVFGLLFLLLNGLLSALGEANLLRPALAAWAAPALFLLLGLFLLHRVDRH
ncbi:MAG: LptF/LptG family permease [Stagnimonas sp.]|nr:LptF/LptG family permease [Stagnimonas sp.]